MAQSLFFFIIPFQILKGHFMVVINTLIDLVDRVVDTLVCHFDTIRHNDLTVKVSALIGASQMFDLLHQFARLFLCDEL